MNLILISEVIETSLENNLLPNTGFRPKPSFYKAIGINKHRFAKIVRDEIEPTRTELKALAEYFKFSLEDAF